MERGIGVIVVDGVVLWLDYVRDRNYGVMFRFLCVPKVDRG